MTNILCRLGLHNWRTRDPLDYELLLAARAPMRIFVPQKVEQCRRCRQTRLTIADGVPVMQPTQEQRSDALDTWDIYGQPDYTPVILAYRNGDVVPNTSMLPVAPNWDGHEVLRRYYERLKKADNHRRLTRFKGGGSTICA